MRARAEEQISAFLKNRPGIVADLCTALNERHINIRALTVLETVDVGTLRMVTDNTELAKQVLSETGAAYVVVPVLSIVIPNRPGAFARIASGFARHGINIEYVYATALGGDGDTLAIFRVSDIERAIEIEFED